MAACGSCDAPIEWAVSAKSGKQMPLDMGTRDDGNIAVRAVSEGGMLLAVYVTPGAGDRVSHFVTCPHAAQHRKSG